MIPQDKRAEEIKERWRRWFDARSFISSALLSCGII
jgi:hypothetical protein